MAGVVDVDGVLSMLAVLRESDVHACFVDGKFRMAENEINKARLETRRDKVEASDNKLHTASSAQSASSASEGSTAVIVVIRKTATTQVKRGHEGSRRSFGQQNCGQKLHSQVFKLVFPLL